MEAKLARTSTITKEAVFETANEILESGEKPTQKGVQAILGGSFNTIGPLFREWEQTRAEQAEARETPIPVAVQDVLSEVAGRIWKTASAEAALGVEAARREVEQMRQDAAAEATATADIIQTIESDRDAAQAHVEALTAETREQAQQIERLQVDLRDQLERRTRAEAQAEAAAARADWADADRQGANEARARAEADVTELREAAATLRAENATLVAERDAAAKGQDKAEARAERLQEELGRVQSDLGGARSDLSTERAQHVATREKLSERLDRLSVDLEAAQDDAAATREERDQAIAAQAQLAARIDELEKEILTIQAGEKKKVTAPE